MSRTTMLMVAIGATVTTIAGCSRTSGTDAQPTARESTTIAVPDGRQPGADDPRPGTTTDRSQRAPDGLDDVAAERLPSVDPESGREPDAAPDAAQLGPSTVDPTADPSAVAGDPFDAATAAVDFLAQFVEWQAAGDADALLASLHPSIQLAFGDDACTAYVHETLGSIAAADVQSVGELAVFEMDTPLGPMGFPETIPAVVEFTTSPGDVFVREVHLPLFDGEPRWLTVCDAG